MDAPFQKRHPSAKVEMSLNHLLKEASKMKITTIGIDLAKNVMQIHGTDKHGNAVLRKQLRRNQLVEFFTRQEPCLIGMEACGSAHHWARKLEQMGHTVKLMAPQFVKPYVKTNKNDMADAEAICEAVGRKNNGQRIGGIRRRRDKFQECPADGSVAGAGPAPAFKRREIDALGHQQAWRYLPAYFAHPRCALGRSFLAD